MYLYVVCHDYFDLFRLAGGKSVTLVPETAQNVFEVLISGMEEFVVSITGEEGRKSYPLLITIFLFVLVGNLMGLVPSLYPPTASVNTTMALALIAVGWSHVVGIWQHGFKYIKHFLGPVPLMIPLFLPIELIAHTARVLSLTFRLFGNMMGHELVVLILLMLGGMFWPPAGDGHGSFRGPGASICVLSAVHHVYCRCH